MTDRTVACEPIRDMEVWMHGMHARISAGKQFDIMAPNRSRKFPGWLLLVPRPLRALTVVNQKQVRFHFCPLPSSEVVRRLDIGTHIHILTERTRDLFFEEKVRLDNLDVFMINCTNCYC